MRSCEDSKNILVIILTIISKKMLNCILGMVEKTKRALAILQHRSESRANEYNNTALWNLPTLRSRHFNPLDVSHSTHSSHDFHELKKSRIDSLLSNHFQKTALSEIDRIADIRRIPGSHKHMGQFTLTHYLTSDAQRPHQNYFQGKVMGDQH